MFELNSKSESALPMFGGAFVLLIASIVLMFISQERIAFISWLSGIGAGICFLMFIFGIIAGIWRVLINFIRGGIKSIALSTIPDIPPAIASTRLDVFNFSKVPQITRPAPTISNKISDYSENDRQIKAHIEYLSEMEAALSRVATKAPEQFSKDSAVVEAQQIVLYRMAHQAAKFTKRVERRFPDIKPNFTDVPEANDLAAPRAPPTRQLQTFSKVSGAFREHFPKGAGQALGRGAVQGGLPGLVLAAGVVLVAGAANVIAFQRLARATLQAHEELKEFAAGAAADIELLGRAHRELTELSAGLWSSSARLRELLLWAKDWEKKGMVMAGPLASVHDRARLEEIAGYAILARIDAARAV